MENVGNFIFVFERMFELFIIMMIGYAACKLGRFGTEARAAVTALVLDITTPALILASVLNAETLPPLGEVLYLLAVSIMCYAITLSLAAALSLLFHKRDRGICRFVLSFGNLVFIGYPVLQAILGNGALFYATIFLMPFHPLIYSLGVAMIRGDAGGAGREDRLRKVREILSTPCMAAGILAFALALLRWRGPALLGRSCALLGSVTTPAALLIVGASLAGMKGSEIFGDLRVYLLSGLKLLAAPLITWVLLRAFVQDPMLLGVAVLMAGMPTAITGTMLCVQYRVDERLISRATFMNTLLSMFTMPLVALLVR